MPERHLSYVQALSPALYRHYDLAYRHCYEDPEYSLVKLRAYAQTSIDLVYRHFKLDDKQSAQLSLYDKINAPEIRNVLPYHVQEQLNFLRVEGNKGAHPGGGLRVAKAAIDSALLGLKVAYKIACWLGETLYQHESAQMPVFIEPAQQYSDTLYGDAVIRDDPEAQYSVGMIFRLRAESLRQSHSRATRQVQPAGHATKPMPPEDLTCLLNDAAYWFGKASRHQHPAALYQLGLMLLHGDGLPEDGQRAEQLIRQAAAHDHPDALYTLGEFWLTGQLGQQSCTRDHAQAFEYFMKAAQQDQLEALNRLVQMYYEGLGVAQDLDEAGYYAHKAALAGYPSAQFKLAHLYHHGLGVARDEAQALHWYRQAAHGGDADAQVVLFKYYANGLLVEKDLVQALEWLQLADAQNHPGAAYYLGLAYLRGIGVRADLVRAITFFKRCILADKEQLYTAAQTEFAQGIRLLREQTLQKVPRKTGLPVPVQTNQTAGKIGRNQPCPCGSGKKYKKCCGLD